MDFCVHLNCLAGLEALCLFLLLHCSLVWANQSVLRREGPPLERTAQDRDRSTLQMVAKSDDAGDKNASTKRKDEAATSERGFSFEKNSTNKALRNAGCELGCNDNEMMFKIKDQAWTSRKNTIEATEYDEKYE